MSVNGKAMMMAEINFLCVHKSLRTKKLSPVLIKEVTRRVHLDNIWQAIYTAGVMIPTPISQATYYHRGIDVKKLIECEFSMLPLNVSMAKHVKKYNLPKNTDVAGLREMTKADVPQVTKLLNEYLNQFSLHIIFS
jgi:glycylpeptide N-tetradecanoyltransferase